MTIREKINLLPFDPSKGRSTKKISLPQVHRLVEKRIGKQVKIEFDYQSFYGFKWVPAEKCYLNYERQRWPEPKPIKDIAENFKKVAFQPVIARYSPSEDRYYIADGQQHGNGWLSVMGPDVLVPVWYITSEDENDETIILLTQNTESTPMAKYFILKQKIIMGDQNAIDLEKTVIDADCELGYKTSKAGTITHITDLESCSESYGNDILGIVLSKYRLFWPTEKVHTATVLGFCKTLALLLSARVDDIETVFDDMFDACGQYFESADRLHLDIKDEFEKTYPTNYKGMGQREKVCSGIIDVYEKIKGKKVIDKPFEIDLPMMKDHDHAIS